MMQLKIGNWGTVSRNGMLTHMEATAFQSSGQIMIFGGYLTFFVVNNGGCIYDKSQRRWREWKVSEWPREMAKTHAAHTIDEHGNLYVISGQPRAGTSEATRNSWILPRNDNTSWKTFPSLPEERYAALCEYSKVDRCLHVFGGATSDRCTNSNAHWILAASGETWERAPDIPFGLCHSASIISGDGRYIYVFGGCSGHAPLNCDASCQCATYDAYTNVFRYDVLSKEWIELSPMTVAAHHVEHQIVVLDDNYVVVLGGSTTGDKLLSYIQIYDIKNDKWTLSSDRLPQARKGGVAWLDGDTIFINGGQTAISETNCKSGRVCCDTICAKFSFS